MLRNVTNYTPSEIDLILYTLYICKMYSKRRQQMSATVNPSELRSFVLAKIGYDTLDKDEAKDLKIDEDKFLEADVDESEDLDVDEILDNEDLYERFATMLAEEKEELTAKDKEQEDEEADKRRTSGKSDSKA